LDKVQEQMHLLGSSSLGGMAQAKEIRILCTHIALGIHHKIPALLTMQRIRERMVLVILNLSHNNVQSSKYLHAEDY